MASKLAIGIISHLVDNVWATNLADSLDEYLKDKTISRKEVQDWKNLASQAVKVESNLSRRWVEQKIAFDSYYNRVQDLKSRLWDTEQELATANRKLAEVTKPETQITYWEGTNIPIPGTTTKPVWLHRVMNWSR